MKPIELLLIGIFVMILSIGLFGFIIYIEKLRYDLLVMLIFSFGCFLGVKGIVKMCFNK